MFNNKQKQENKQKTKNQENDLRGVADAHYTMNKQPRVGNPPPPKAPSGKTYWCNKTKVSGAQDKTHTSLSVRRRHCTGIAMRSISLTERAFRQNILLYVYYTSTAIVWSPRVLRQNTKDRWQRSSNPVELWSIL